MNNTQSILYCPQCRATIPKMLLDVQIAGCAHCGTVSTMQADGSLRKEVVYEKLTKDEQLPFECLQFRLLR